MNDSNEPARGRRGAGRPKGAKNKTTRAIKEALAEAFEKLGGVPFMVEWAKANPGEFFKLWVKMLPLELTGQGGGDIQHTVEVVVKRDRDFFGRSPAPRAVDATEADHAKAAA